MSRPLVASSWPDARLAVPAPIVAWSFSHRRCYRGARRATTFFWLSSKCTGQQRRAERRRLADHYLSLVGLAEGGEQYPDAMSAGMRQRVGIARALALEPRVLLLDEPFSLLDALTRMELQDEIMRLWEEDRKTVVMVTHDVDEALLLADRIVMMTNGPAATIGQILTVPFARPRTRHDVLNHPDYYMRRDELIAFLEGQAPVRAGALADC